MLTLIKSYYVYHKYIVATSFAFVILINTALAFSGDWHEAQSDFPGLRVVWLAPFSIWFLIFHLVDSKEKRLRLYRILPLPVYKMALSRLISVLIFWIVTLLILLLFNTIMTSILPDLNWIYDNTAMTGIIAVINAVPLIYNDLLSVAETKRARLAITTLWTVVTLIIIVFVFLSLPYLSAISPAFIATTGGRLSELYFSLSGKIAFVFLGLAFSAINVFLFTKRKTYLT